MSRPSLLERARRWAKAIARDVVALWLAARDPRVPWHAKAVAAAVAAYALSPIDLIPDFVPILGYLDDFVVIPLGVLLAVKLMPPAILAELRKQAESRSRPRSLAGLTAILAIWLAAIAVTILWFWPAD